MTKVAITAEGLSKLPKWAQEYVANLERERDTAVRALHEYLDNQTPSRIFAEDMLCTKPGPPEHVKIYYQVPRSEVTFDLDVVPQNTAYRPRENQITVRIDREDPSQVLISAAWNQMSLYPIASNTIALRGTRK